MLNMILIVIVITYTVQSVATCINIMTSSYFFVQYENRYLRSPENWPGWGHVNIWIYSLCKHALCGCTACKLLKVTWSIEPMILFSLKKIITYWTQSCQFDQTTAKTDTSSFHFTPTPVKIYVVLKNYCYTCKYM